mgnify:CR=1 FL=1
MCFIKIKYFILTLGIFTPERSEGVKTPKGERISYG